MSSQSLMKQGWIWNTIIVLGVVGAAWFFFPMLIGPPPPNRVVIATGSESGVYYSVAQRYQQKLAEQGIELEIRPTAGSVENLQLLHAEEVSLAIAQGGTSREIDHVEFTSLGSLYLEPVWLFYRTEIGKVNELADLKDYRIGVGSEGSGTRAIALKWLQINALIEATGEHPNLVPISGQAALKGLQEKTLDAAFFVIGPRAPVITELLQTPGLSLMSFRRAHAYETHYRYLQQVTLTEGTLKLDENIPGEDITLLAATANLVARKDLHPALVLLLLEAAHEVHEGGGVFEAPGEFPSPLGVELPLNEDAKRYFKDGPSFLYRYLPFGVANWLDRMKMLLAPLLMLLFPLLKAFPPVYRLRIRSRIYRWYRVLREIDQKLADSTTTDFTVDIERLKSLETELAEVSVPLSYMEEFYNLRIHVRYVSDLLSTHPITVADENDS